MRVFMPSRSSTALLFFCACISILSAPGRAQTATVRETAPPAIDPALPIYAPASKVSGTLKGVTGMDSVESMFKAWSDAFAKYHPGSAITVVQRDVAPEERIAIGPNSVGLSMKY